MDIFCYGATSAEADELHDSVFEVMSQLRRTAFHSHRTLLHNAIASGGGKLGRDRDATWPVAFMIFNVHYSPIS